MRVLGIETSCDDTGVAIFDGQKGIVAHSLYSQTKLHNEYGGVVPELASRDHISKILPLVEQTLQEGNCVLEDIDAVAYTKGPGLMGALLTGAAFAKSFALARKIPVIGIHHLEAHLLAVMLESHVPDFPFLALLVSGGHTLLIKVIKFGQYQILGETLDDAAGEAFDKTAKILGLGYPGGPELAKLAKHGTPNHFVFPRPMVNRPGLDFSFSGLKTFALNTYQKNSNKKNIKANLALAFEVAVVDTLYLKVKRALNQTGLNRLVVAGGVSANLKLRQTLKTLSDQLPVEVFYPRLEFCCDNGAMVAYTGFSRLKAGYSDNNWAIEVKPRWNLEDISIPRST